MRTRTTTHRLVVLAAAGMLVACGGSSSSKTGSGTSSAPSASAATGAAAQRVAAFTAHPGTLTNTKPVKVPAGAKTLVYMQCVQVVCKEIGDAMTQASAAVGAKFVRVTHQDTPATVQQAAVTALQANPAAVFTSGDPTEWFADQIKQMNARKIPVVAWSLPGAFTANGLSANLLTGDDYYFDGVLEADWVASHSGSSGESLLLNVPAYPVLATLAQGYKDELSKVCPSCKVTEADFTVQDIISGNVSTAAVAALQRNPKITYVVGTFGGLITQQLAQAVQNGGFSKVKAISAAGTSANYALIKSGNFQEADLALSSGFLAWRAVDSALRVMNGQSAASTEPLPELAKIPGHPNILAGGVRQEFVTKVSFDAAGAGTNFDTVWSPVADYQSGFKKLWGVS